MQKSKFIVIKTYFNILVTGTNKIGKTTLIKKIISQFKNSYQNKVSFENSSIIEINSQKSSSIFEVTFDEVSKRKYKKTQFFKNYELILNNSSYGNYVINLIDSPYVEENKDINSNSLHDVIINKINSCHDQYHIKLNENREEKNIMSKFELNKEESLVFDDIDTRIHLLLYCLDDDCDDTINNLIEFSKIVNVIPIITSINKSKDLSYENIYNLKCNIKKKLEHKMFDVEKTVSVRFVF